MKRIIHAFLVILIVIGTSTCKKENIEKELPELIGNWQFYGASYNSTCLYRVFSEIYNNDFNEPNLISLDNTFKIEITKRKIKFDYLDIIYSASINKGSIKKYKYFEYFYINNEIKGYCKNNMNYIPKIGEVTNGNDNDFIEINLTYSNNKLSELSNQAILKKIIATDNNGIQKEFLQMFIYDIKSTVLVKVIPSYQSGIYDCGATGLIVLSFEKI